MALDVRTADGSVTFAVRVQPGAKREGVVGLYGDVVKLALTAPAVDGKANEALVRYLAGLFNVPRLSIEIAAGHTSRSKVVRIIGISREEAVRAFQNLLVV